MENDVVVNYVSERLKGGVSLSSLREELLAVGWSREEIESIAESALVRNGVPAPAGAAQKLSGRAATTAEVAINFFSFILLTTVAIASGTVLYQVINHFFSDPLQIGYYGFGEASASVIRYGIATLLVSFPLYFFAIRFWLRRYRADESRVESRLTKWLSYIVLLVSAGTIVGDLITALFYFLSGELSVRFVLKVLTLLVIAGTIFGLYFLERRLVQYRKPVSTSVFYRFAGIGAALVVLSILLGFTVSGSPSQSREAGLDDQRENNLRNLASCIESYARSTKRLPQTLGELSQNTSQSYCSGYSMDPVSGTPYQYRVINPSQKKGNVIEGTFELCATFSLSSKAKGGNNAYYSQTEKWADHPAGKACDQETVVLESIEETRSTNVPMITPEEPLPGNVPVRVPSEGATTGNY